MMKVKKNTSMLVRYFLWYGLMCTVNGFTTLETKQSVGKNYLSTSNYRPSPFVKEECTRHASLGRNFKASCGSTSLSLGINLPFTINLQNELVTYFLQTCINVFVPAVAWIIVIAFTANAFRSGNNRREMNSPFDTGFDGTAPVEEIYSDLFGEAPSKRSPSMLPPFLRPPTKALKNFGSPAETFIKVTKYNDILNSYDYSLTSALESKASASKTYRSQTLGSALEKVLPSTMKISEGQRNKLLYLESEFLQEGGALLKDMQILQKKLTDVVITDEMKMMDVKVGELDPIPYTKAEEASIVDVNATSNENKNPLSGMAKNMPPMFNPNKRQEMKFTSKLSELNSEITSLELDFVRAMIEILGPEYANGVRAILLGNLEGGNGVGPGNLLRFIDTERPIAALFNSTSSEVVNGDAIGKKRLFFTEFPGDATASQVSDLREEVTAILRSARPEHGDEALLVLQTGGGTVTGYGLAAAQLKRIKEAGMKLTICVEQVAASGGYMMCCVADRIVASPFAVLGSIGVISDVPNVYERLKKEGIEFQTVTAGKYKRTLTPTKKVNKEDIEKYQTELQDILVLFKEFVKQNRPSLDIDNVATGETWFGENALKKGLCDEIKTKDDVLLEFVDGGYDVYEIAYEPMDSDVLGLPLRVSSSSSERRRISSNNANKSWLRRAISWIAQEVREEIIDVNESFYSTADTTNDIKKRYMARDIDSFDKLRF